MGGSIVLLPLLAVLAALEWGWIESFVVTSESMSPTLEKFDQVIVDRRLGRPFRRGDLVTFPNPGDPGRPRLVKRVLALEGDRLEVRDGRLFLNGEQAAEPYLKEPASRLNVPDLDLRVPEGTFFAAGDNRNASHDSFQFGPVPLDAIDGRVAMIYWPPRRWSGLAPSPRGG